jgi:oxidase EvaA
MVLELPPDVEVDLRDNFRWMTLGELRQHLRVDTLVNMNTRSVLSCLQLMAWDRPLDAQPTTGLDVSGLDDLARMSLTSSTTLQSLHSTEELMDWLTRNKCNSFLEVTPCRLDELSEWVIRDDAIAHREDKYFAVIGVEAQVGRREVGHWCQPMIWQRERGIVGFLVRRIDDVMHVLVQAKIEPGNVDVVELAPTVQCITGSYLRPEYEVPFLDYFTGARGRVHVDVLHSEEGGRFYQELNRYMVVEVDHDLELPADRYVWMTMAQVKNFIMHNNCFNIEARSLVSCMGPV